MEIPHNDFFYEQIFPIPEIEAMIIEYLYLIDYSKLKQLNHYYYSLISSDPLYVEYQKFSKNYYDTFTTTFKAKTNATFYLIDACQNKYWFLAKYFLSKYDVDIHYDDNTIFRWCCNNGNLEMVSDLYTKSISNGKTINIHVDSDGAFRYSCYHGHLNITKYLLTLNGKINIFACGYYALTNSCINGHLEMAEYLYRLYLENNIDHDKLIGIFCRILDEIIERNHYIETIKWIYSLNIVDNYIILKNICRYDNLDIIKWFISSEPNVINAVNNGTEWRNLLSMSSHIQEIIEYTYSIDASSVINNIRLFDAICVYGHLNVLQWYISLNPDFVNHFDTNEWDKLCASVTIKSSPAKIKYFIFLRPEMISQLSSYTWHNLFYAMAENDNLGEVQLLYSLRPGVEFPRNVFYVCCTNGYSKIIKWIYSLNPKLLLKPNYEIQIIFRNVCNSKNLQMLKYLYSIDEIKDKLIASSTELFEYCCESRCLIFGEFKAHCNVINSNATIAEWLYSINNNITINFSRLNELFVENCKYPNLRIIKLLYELNPKIECIENQDRFEKLVRKINSKIRNKRGPTEKLMEVLEWLNTVVTPI